MNTATLPNSDSCEIVFAEGIIGVPRARRFQLMEKPGSQVRLLHCLDVRNFSLPVVDPMLIDPGYLPRLGDRIPQVLGIGEKDDVLLLVVATVTPSGTVANLRAPLVVNASRRTGMQVILDDRSQPLRAPVNVS